MAYYKITTDKKGKLVAKMQAYGKDLETGEKNSTQNVFTTKMV